MIVDFDVHGETAGELLTLITALVSASGHGIDSYTIREAHALFGMGLTHPILGEELTVAACKHLLDIL